MIIIIWFESSLFSTLAFFFLSFTPGTVTFVTLPSKRDISMSNSTLEYFDFYVMPFSTTDYSSKGSQLIQNKLIWDAWPSSDSLIFLVVVAVESPHYS